MLAQIYVAGLFLAQRVLAAQGSGCTSLTLDETPPGTSLINITATERYNVTVSGTRFNSTGTVSNINFCDVQLFLTHGGSDADQVRIALWLPLPPNSWNGRFLGTGGAGFNAGVFDPALAEGVEGGFATASTDAGVGLTGDPRAWANSERLVDNFIHLSVHEMTYVAKALTAKFYGRDPTYSYWHGCSQGGRQGYVEALRYPDDYDGISAHAPGINWDRLLPGFLWPYLQGHIQTPSLTVCKLNAIMAASITACDGLDGALDGLIGHPPDCTFNALTLVGAEIPSCPPENNLITTQEAIAWNSIRAGPQDTTNTPQIPLWHGMEPGSDLSFITPTPFPPAESWLQDFILREPDFDPSTLTYSTYLAAFNLSVTEFRDTWGSPDADLSRFQQRGGKLLTFHGWADQSIPGNSTIEYWRRVGRESVAARDGDVSTSSSATAGGGDEDNDEEGRGEAWVNSFFRLFMAPGVGHCANFGYGPGPVNPLDSLVEWVESGKAPDTLFAAGFGKTRELCRYPLKTKYIGSGDVNDAGSWTCV